MGTEFKTFVSALLYANGFIEIEEGKERMKTKQYFRRLGTTSACVRRLLDAALQFDTTEPVVSAKENSSFC